MSMKNKDTKFLSVKVPTSLYEALRRWADNNDTDVSKTCRIALRNFCHKNGIEIDEGNDTDPLAQRLKEAGISIEDLE